MEAAQSYTALGGLPELTRRKILLVAWVEACNLCEKAPNIRAYLELPLWMSRERASSLIIAITWLSCVT